MNFKELAYFGFFAKENESEEELVERYQKQAALHFASRSALDLLEKRFKVRPSWVKVAYCRDQTSFLQPAVTVIEGDSSMIYVRDSPRCEGEFLPHEMVHALRAPLESPLFEEMAAYQLHPWWLVRFFGPLFTKYWEPWLFLALYFAGSMIVPFWLLGGGVLMAGPLCYFFARLFYLRFYWERAKAYLRKHGGEESEAALFWMKDEEIKNPHLCGKKKSDRLRWMQLAALYPGLCSMMDQSHLKNG